MEQNNMDDLWQIIVLSIIQGFTEVLPISSSAHLILINEIFSLGQMSFTFAVALHFGSIFAILWRFRHDVLWLWRSFWTSSPISQLPKSQHLEVNAPTNGRILIFYFCLSLLPTAVLSTILKPIAITVFDHPTWAGVFLIINGLIILATVKWTHGERTLLQFTWWEFLLIGFIQGLAVLPGISRLGITLCAGLFLRLNWYQALRLTFILAIPTITGGVFLELDAGSITPILANFSGDLIALLGSSIVVFFISSYGLKLLTQSWLERRTLIFFGHYCWMWGLFSLTYALSTTIAASS